MSDIDQRVVFAATKDDRGVLTLVVGIPVAAWEYIKDGKTVGFDLSRAGVPVQLIAFGAKDHDDAKATIDRINAHWVLSKAERAKGFIRPVRRAYVHDVCGGATSMPLAIAETYARDPDFYGQTFCCTCGEYLPVAEFTWLGSVEKVGS